MNPIERALGILLMLSGGRLVPATAIAEKFEVSLRTIYRDVDRLLALGVPVEAERGAVGGYRLADGYLQAPVALTRSETAALLVALAVARGLKATPLVAELDSAQGKLLASMPRAARELLLDGSRLVGIERQPPDIFHGRYDSKSASQSQSAVDAFMSGLLGARRVRFEHRNPSRDTARFYEVEPRAILFDRDLWYLVGHSIDAGDIRMWRADRVIAIEVTGMAFRQDRTFSVQSMLGRSWLGRAMEQWAQESEMTRIRMTERQAETLRQDWYYAHALFEPDEGGTVRMTVPDTSPRAMLSLVRWLGPEAELLGPPHLRRQLTEELAVMARHYEEGGAAGGSASG
jgi:predicted DNA-binding transcriptional regulator YafY